jgi:N-acylneuraminate cytidylyltransferase/CMP-N,N'-diacetyllegionaminic acid synthase
MINNKKVLAIIPARGGSKGLPGKNIKSLYGKPLIAWTIEEAKKSNYIDKILVSSDDKEIIEIAKKYRAEVPFVRPKELASNTAKGIDVIKHAINYFKEEFKIIILLQPTSPLRTVKDIEKAFNEFEREKVKAVVSVCELEHPLQWTGTLPANLNMKNFIRNSIKNTNRQELEIYYRLNGAIYISEINYLKENNGFLGSETYAFLMNRENSVDIDDIIDFKLAEILLKERKNEKC